MAGKIQLTPAELLAQSQEMLSLQQEFEGLFQKTSGLLEQVNGDWSENLANNFAGKLTSAQKSFVQVVSMLAQGSSAAATSAKSFESIDSLLAKNMAGDGWSVAGVAAGIAANVASTASVAGAKLSGIDLSFVGTSMATSAGQYEDQNLIEWFIDDLERHPEIWNDFVQDIMGLIPIKGSDLKTVVNTTMDFLKGEADLNTWWNLIKSTTDDTIYGKVFNAAIENIQSLEKYNQLYQGLTQEQLESGNPIASTISMIGAGVDGLIIGPLDVGGDILVEIWDGFPGTNMFEYVFGIDVSESWQGFTEDLHEVVYDVTETVTEFVGDVEETGREVIENVIDWGKDTAEAIGDGLSDAGDALGDWWDSLW